MRAENAERGPRRAERDARVVQREAELSEHRVRAGQ
jgi:hypothetical protein